MYEVHVSQLTTRINFSFVHRRKVRVSSGHSDCLICKWLISQQSLRHAEILIASTVFSNRISYAWATTNGQLCDFWLDKMLEVRSVHFNWLGLSVHAWMVHSRTKSSCMYQFYVRALWNLRALRSCTKLPYMYFRNISIHLSIRTLVHGNVYRGQP